MGLGSFSDISVRHACRFADPSPPLPRWQGMRANLVKLVFLLSCLPLPFLPSGRPHPVLQQGLKGA